MTVTTSGHKYRFTFRHVLDDGTPDADILLGEIEQALSLTPASLHGFTECYISLVDGPKAQVPQGIALCSVLDKFDKETGRKLALSRALQAVFPKTHENWKALRTAFWLAYHNRGQQA